MQMSTDLMSFNNEQFGTVRSVMKDGEPWFVANDVCVALEIDRTQTRRLDDDEKGVYSTQTLGGNQEISVINEPGLYSLVLGSRKPEAKQFKRWVTHEIIPSIRKTGSYELQPMSQLEILELQVQTLRDHDNRLAKQEQLLAEQNERLNVLQFAYKNRPENARDWRKSIKEDIDSYCARNNLSHGIVWNDLYRELELRSKASLQNRLTRRKNIMRRECRKTSDINAVSKLEIVSEDLPLRNMFDVIVREWLAGSSKHITTMLT